MGGENGRETWWNVDLALMCKPELELSVEATAGLRIRKDKKTTLIGKCNQGGPCNRELGMSGLTEEVTIPRQSRGPYVR